MSSVRDTPWDRCGSNVSRPVFACRFACWAAVVYCFICCRPARPIPLPSFDGGVGVSWCGGLRTQECVCTTLCLYFSGLPVRFPPDIVCGVGSLKWVEAGPGFFVRTSFPYKGVASDFFFNEESFGSHLIGCLFMKFFVEGSILAQDERWRRA